MARWAKWIPTLKFQAAGRRPLSGLDQGNVGIARPALLCRITAAIASWTKRSTQQASRCGEARADRDGRSIQPREQATAIAIRVQTKSCARQAWSMAKSRPRLVSIV